MNLADIKKGSQATVVEVIDVHEQDPISRRMRELGFIAGETVKVVAKGFLGGNPLVVQIGGTRFALRKKEAQRVRIQESV